MNKILKQNGLTISKLAKLLDLKERTIYWHKEHNWLKLNASQVNKIAKVVKIDDEFLTKQIIRDSKTIVKSLFDVVEQLDAMPIQVQFMYQDGVYWLTDGFEQFGQIHLDHIENIKLGDYVYETICQLEVDLDEHPQIAYSDIRQKIEQVYDLFNKWNEQLN